MIREDRTFGDEGARVVDDVVLVLRIAEVDGDASRVFANAREGLLGTTAQTAMQQEILGRIAAERHFREKNQVAAELVACARRRFDDACAVGFNRAYARIELGKPDSHPSALAIVSPRSASERTVWTPAFSSAAYFSTAVPLPPAMIAPACPMRLPGGAVTPAI